MSIDTSAYANLFRLDGRTVFLSGAAGHLGRAMSVALAQAGAHVILNGRSRAKLEVLCDEMRGVGLDVSVAAFDVMDRVVADGYLGSLERLHVLINNAFTGLPTKEDPHAGDAFARALASGVSAAYQNVQAALPALRAAADEAGQASVINVTSIYGHVSPRFDVYGDSGLNSPPQYGAAKGGLLQLTRYLACELAPQRIRVNSLSPGIFPWDGVAETHGDFLRRVSAVSPLGRPGRASEIGGPTVFLASDASSYMTGADLLIDGGWVAQ